MAAKEQTAGRKENRFVNLYGKSNKMQQLLKFISLLG
jgi:hypothetical protein